MYWISLKKYPIQINAHPILGDSIELWELLQGK